MCSMSARRFTLRDKFRGCSSLRAAELQPPRNFRKLKKYLNKTLRWEIRTFFKKYELNNFKFKFSR